MDEAKPLKKSGLRNQHQECEAVLDAVQGALDSLAENDYKNTKEYLEQGKLLLQKRIKILRIADRNGWKAVRIYQEDPIASDAEDERRLKKAIKQAEAEKKSAPKQKVFRKPYRSSSSRKYGSNRKRCYTCDSPYHMARGCPKTRADRKSATDYAKKT